MLQLKYFYNPPNFLNKIPKKKMLIAKEACRKSFNKAIPNDQCMH